MRGTARWAIYGGGLAALALSVSVATAAIRPAPGDLAFAVYRGDAPFGSHRIAFETRDEELHVTVEIDLAVRAAFLTLFRYTHRNREVWRDGRLVRLDTETDDDGRRHWVRARAEADGLRVESTAGTITVPPDIVPTSYWHPATVEQTRMLDTQHGRIVEVSIDRMGSDPVLAGYRALPATRFRMSGDLDLDLWYGEDGTWLQTRFSVRGSDISYRAEHLPAAVGAADG